MPIIILIVGLVALIVGTLSALYMRMTGVGGALYFIATVGGVTVAFLNLLRVYVEWKSKIRSKFGGWDLWAVLVCLLISIMMAKSASLVVSLGYEAIGQYLYEFRHVIWVFFGMWLAIKTIANGVRSIQQRARRGSFIST